MGANLTVEICGGLVRKGRGTLPDGTEVKTGETFVNAGGARKFVSGAWTDIGVDDAEKVRAAKAGEPVPLTWAQKLKIAKERSVARFQAALSKVGGVENPYGGAAVSAAVPLTGLAAQLQGFEDDPEMQQMILDRWNKKRTDAKAAKAAAAPVEKAAASA